MELIDVLLGSWGLWKLVVLLFFLLWLFLPFAVYGIKPKVDSLDTRLRDLLDYQDKLIAIHEKSNEKLEALYEESIMFRQQQLEISVKQSTDSYFEENTKP